MLTESSDGFFVGPTIFDNVAPEMKIASDEIFGPVLSVMRVDDLSEAIARANESPYGNGAVIFTRDGGAARTFARYVNCGMIGVNVGVPAPMAIFRSPDGTSHSSATCTFRGTKASTFTLTIKSS